MNRLLYVVGIPGAGKTTLLRATMDGCPSAETIAGIKRTVYWPEGSVWNTDQPKPGVTVSGYELGVSRKDFGGTDTLPWNVQPGVLEWLGAIRVQGNANVIAEGDRLANSKFFREVLNLGYELEIVHLDTDLQEAARRRAERGSQQDEKWIKGRITKIMNLKTTWEAQLVTINGNLPLLVQVEQLRKRPAIEAIRSGSPGRVALKTF